jgi:RNA 2',3'-cyclic 3'-phosphodiesterase
MRLFTAIDIPDDIRTRLGDLISDLRPLAKLGWAKPEKLHITTKFIGEWPEEKLAALQVALEPVKSPTFRISIRGVGWMPPTRNARVLFAHVEAGAELSALAQATEDALAEIGVLVEDRAYRPHLTLARRKDRVPTQPIDQAIANLEPDFGSFLATKFVLFHSHGGEYTQLKEFSFT